MNSTNQDALSIVLSAICPAEITLSKVWSDTEIPLVSKSATMATAASSSPRSRHNVMTSSYRGLQKTWTHDLTTFKFHIEHVTCNLISSDKNE